MRRSLGGLSRARPGLGGALAAGLALALAPAAVPAQCSTQHCSITGGPGQGTSTQIGGGLPIPASVVNPSPPPLFLETRRAQPGGTLVAGQGSKYGSIVLPPGLFKFEPRFQNVPVFLDNSHVFQVATDFGGTFPTQSATLAVGRRTGPRTLRWCPHLPLPTASYNPFCTGPSSVANITNGILRYAGTSRQFGGPAVGRVTTGAAQVALQIGFAPGCPPGFCRVAHVVAYGVIPGEIGGSFGTPNGAGESSPLPIPTGHVIASQGVGQFGTILSLDGSFMFRAGFTPTNRATSWGGPWTTGMIQIQVGYDGPETFTLTGSNNRSSMGDGTISLVAGAISRRSLSGVNANRGWLSFTVPEPRFGLGAAAALVALVACRATLGRGRA